MPSLVPNHTKCLFLDLTPPNTTSLVPFTFLPQLTFIGDPLPHIQSELSHYRPAKAYELKPAILNGAAIGYIGYDCVRYFEPRVASHYDHLTDPLAIPESILLFTNSFVYIDYENKILKFVALCHLDKNLNKNYDLAVDRIAELELRLSGNPDSVSNRRLQALHIRIVSIGS
jgi:anthranilate/para-aminobenzoate synthase component I